MEDLKIKLKVENMIVYGYSALRQFPKSEKHTLAAEIRLRRQYAAGEIAARDVQLQLNSWLAHAGHANAEGFVRSVIYDTPWERHHAAVCD